MDEKRARLNHWDRALRVCGHPVQGCGASAEVVPNHGGAAAGKDGVTEGAGTGTATAAHDDTTAADKYTEGQGDATAPTKQAPAEPTAAQAAGTSCAPGAADPDAPKLGAQLLSAGAAVMEAGGKVAGKASTALSEATAAAKYRGQDASSSSSSARAMLDSIGALGNNDDVKKVLGATWILVSESAKFFTIGKVAVAVLQQCYDMWNAWDNKNVWVCEFVSYLKLVEEDLVAGLNVFEHAGFLRGLEKQLEASRALLQVITTRGRAAAFVCAMYDEQALEEQKVLIEARKRECLFGHATDVKNVAAQNLELMQRIAALVQERQKKLEAYRLYPEGLEARGRRMKQLAENFRAFDNGKAVQDLVARFVRVQRAFRLGRWDEPARARYVSKYLSGHVLTPALEEAQAGSAVLEPEQAAREALAFGELSPALQLRQLAQLREALATAVADAQQALAQRDYAEALAHVKQGRGVLSSLRVLASAEEAASLSDKFAGQLTAVHEAVRREQLQRGLLLPEQHTLEQLLFFTAVTPQEREAGLLHFRRAFARELDQAACWLRVDADAPRWTAGMPSRGRLLAVRAPPPQPATAAPGGTEAFDPAEVGGVTTAMFVAFLSELYPSSMRALHFVPNRSARAADLAARAARKRERELARAAAQRAQASASSDDNGWRERNARRAALREAGDYASDDEEEPAATAATPAAVDVAVEPESAEESAAAEFSCDDSVSQGDLRRAFPSLSFQLSQSCPTYYSNLLALGAMLTPAGFARLNASDFVADLLVAPLLHPGKAQANPNHALPVADGSSALHKVCMAIDGAQWSVSGGSDAEGEAAAPASSSAVPVAFEDSFLSACSKQIPRLPDWMGFVVTIPHASRFDRRVLQAGAKIHSLDLATHALSDLSAFADDAAITEG